MRTCNYRLKFVLKLETPDRQQILICSSDDHHQWSSTHTIHRVEYSDFVRQLTRVIQRKWATCASCHKDTDANGLLRCVACPCVPLPELTARPSVCFRKIKSSLCCVLATTSGWCIICEPADKLWVVLCECWLTTCLVFPPAPSSEKLWQEQTMVWKAVYHAVDFKCSELALEMVCNWRVDVSSVLVE